VKPLEQQIQSVRSAYDRTASEYAKRFFQELGHKPFDRSILKRFAETVKGRIADIACGPGEIAHFLNQNGNDVFGIDISEAMIEKARELTPCIPFRVGNMFDLELFDGSLSGITAFYAIVNFTPEQASKAFSEFHRVLEPGGQLLISFHIGEGEIHLEEFLGEPIAIDFTLFNPDEIIEKLKGTGFEIVEAIIRHPYAEIEYQTKRAYLWLKKFKS